MSGVGMLVESIEKERKQVPTLPSNCTIYRVPVMLRRVNPEAYTPQLVSIGPFHRQNQCLKPMEVHKLQYLNEFLSRNSQVTLLDYINSISGLEERARKCYSEIINLRKDEFIKMLLIDGCFILKLFLRKDKWEQYRDDPILSKTWMSRAIMRDLLLLENQIPFFILQKLKTLFNRSKKEARATPLCDLARKFFGEIMLHRRESFWTLLSGSINRLARDGNLIDLENLEENEESEDDSEGKKHLLDFLRHLHLPSSPTPLENHGKFRRIHSATDLHEADVKFESGSETCLFEIEFHLGLGKLRIPPIKIGDWTDSVLRNLIAFEQCHSDCIKYLTAYAAFMDGLIVSPKDVELLEKNKIIDNSIGRHEKVTELFSKILQEVTIPSNKFYFSGICEEVETYYEKMNVGSMRYCLNKTGEGIHELRPIFSLIWENRSEIPLWRFLKRLPYLLMIFIFLGFVMKWRNIMR